MKFLGIDTSGGTVLVAAVNGEKQAVRAVAGVTSVRLMDDIDGVLNEVGLPLADADFIACVVGPGSFTGIRIGISTAKGLCFALNKKALSLTSFDLLAYAEKGKALALVDAGHSNYYACPFENGERGEGAFLNESELAFYKEAGYRFLSAKPLAVESEIVDSGYALIGAAQKYCENLQNANALTALYLRKSSAEEKR